MCRDTMLHQGRRVVGRLRCMIPITCCSPGFALLKNQSPCQHNKPKACWSQETYSLFLSQEPKVLQRQGHQGAPGRTQSNIVHGSQTCLILAEVRSGRLPDIFVTSVQVIIHAHAAREHVPAGTCISPGLITGCQNMFDLQVNSPSNGLEP